MENIAKHFFFFSKSAGSAPFLFVKRLAVASLLRVYGYIIGKPRLYAPQAYSLPSLNHTFKTLASLSAAYHE